MLGRRDLLRLGAAMAAGAALAPLAAACTTGPPGGASAGGSVPPPITLLHGGGDPRVEPALWQVYKDFAALHAEVTWDIRAIPGGGPDWDRLARAQVAAGEPVGLIVMDGQQVRSWARDGLLADLSAEPAMAQVLARVPQRFQFAATGTADTRAFPLAVTRGINTTGLFYNGAILEQAGLGPPTTMSALKAMVAPLARIGVAPLVHCAGDAIFNPMLVAWVLPMLLEGTADPMEFAERTLRGEIRYDDPEWVAAFEILADLRTSGVLMEGSGAVDYATMQQLLLQGRAAMTYNGTWLLPQLVRGSPTVEFELHAAPLPGLVEGRPARSILAWGGYALPSRAAVNQDSVIDFLEYASRPEVDRAVVEGAQVYSPIAGSNEAIANDLVLEFMPMFDDAITPLDWLWEPEITAEMGIQVQALLKGDADPVAVGSSLQAVADDLHRHGRSYRH
jgi:ABC-type glycerol-3-phosphate transport system substrate-binding protein